MCLTYVTWDRVYDHHPLNKKKKRNTKPWDCCYTVYFVDARRREKRRFASVYWNTKFILKILPHTHRYDFSPLTYTCVIQNTKNKLTQCFFLETNPHTCEWKPVKVTTQMPLHSMKAQIFSYTEDEPTYWKKLFCFILLFKSMGITKGVRNIFRVRRYLINQSCLCKNRCFGAKWIT